MPISIEKKLIFVRIPNESDAAVNSILDLEDQSHHGVSYYLDNYQGAFSKTKKVCVIRNPWDRLAYFFEQVKQNPEALDHDKLVDSTFEEFVEDFENNRDSYQNVCWLPQTAWIWSDYGPIVNHIFVEDPEYLETPQLTTLETQFKMLLKMEVEIPEIDREAALERRKAYYTPELVERVSKLFSHEIQAFSYHYDPLSQEEEPVVVSTKPQEE